MLLFLLLLSVNAQDNIELVASHRQLLINSLCVFGDSNVDPGDSINVVDTETKYTMKVGLMADFPPYGIDFDNMAMATGHFKNGKTAADFLGNKPPAIATYT